MFMRTRYAFEHRFNDIHDEYIFPISVSFSSLVLRGKNLTVSKYI